MTRLAKLYMVAATVALIGFVAFYSFTLVVSRAQHIESLEVVGNIAVTARIVTPGQLDALFQDPSLASSRSDLYLVTRASLKTVPSKRVMGAELEFVSPESLKGQRVSIGGGFLGEAGYDVKHLASLSSLSEDQKTLVLSSKPELKVISAWVK